jgi:NAD(P)H dehydrogenase (quinone)
VRVLVVYTHPSPESFTAAVRDRYLAGLASGGHQVDVLDLYAIDFNPILGADERTGRKSEPIVVDHGALVRNAEALVFIQPTWWSGPPAITKGWIERVLGTDPTGATTIVRSTAQLRHIRRLVVVTTHGSPRYVNLIEGEAGKLLFRRYLRRLISVRGRFRWIALYNIDRATPAQRQRFLAQVETSATRL